VYVVLDAATVSSIAICYIVKHVDGKKTMRWEGKLYSKLTKL